MLTKDYGKKTSKANRAILAFCIITLSFMLYPQKNGSGQIKIPPPESINNEEKKVIIEEKAKVALSAVNELVKNVDALPVAKVVYRTKIKVITIRDSFYYPVLVDSMRFFDFATEIPDTVVVYKTDTVYLEKKKNWIKSIF